MIKYEVRFFKSGIRIRDIRGLSVLEARLFMQSIEGVVSKMKQRFKYITDHDSIFIQVGDDEMFRNRKRLKEAGIITVGDIIEYLGVDAEYILADNVEVNKDKKISEIDTLELYSSLGDKNKEYIKKLGDKYGYETG